MAWSKLRRRRIVYCYSASLKYLPESRLTAVGLYGIRAMFWSLHNGTIFLKRGGISLPLPEILQKKQEDIWELKGVEDFEKKERLEEAGVEGKPDLPAMMASLGDMQCRILMSLLSSGQFSKKELQEKVNATSRGR